jgi:5-hydroxyisourate hydrolase-like protein (transthyretin family)
MSSEFLKNVQQFCLGVVITAAAFFPHAFFAQDRSAGSSQGVTYSGLVVDRATGKPLKGIQVIFTNTSNERRTVVRTNKDGIYKVVNIPPGIYAIQYSSPRTIISGMASGFVVSSSPQYQTEEITQTLTLLGDHPRGATGISFLGIPTHRIGLEPVGPTTGYEGDVFDRFTEDPIAGVKVEITNLSSGRSEFVSTNLTGRFSRSDLLVGRYTIEFSAPGYRTRKIEETLSAGAVNRVGTRLGLILLTPDEAKPSAANLARSAILFGNYHALIIGNDNYQSPIRKLKNAVNDAVTVEAILREKYGFRTKLLRNVAGHDIVGAINAYKKTLT